VIGLTKKLTRSAPPFQARMHSIYREAHRTRWKLNAQQINLA
jgi:hypothetical protein